MAIKERKRPYQIFRSPYTSPQQLDKTIATGYFLLLIPLIPTVFYYIYIEHKFDFDPTIQLPLELFSMTGALWFVLITLLAIITTMLALKQWGYYFGGTTDLKSGLFADKIKQVDHLDNLIDHLLCGIGVALIIVIFLPTFWFFVLVIYSWVASFRCFRVVMRPNTAKKLRRQYSVDPKYYEESLSKKHNELVVEHILVGWMVSFLIWSIVAGISFTLLFIRFIPIIPIKLLAIIMVLIQAYFFFQFANGSYRIGKRICEWIRF